MLSLYITWFVSYSRVSSSSWHSSCWDEWRTPSTPTSALSIAKVHTTITEHTEPTQLVDLREFYIYKIGRAHV